MSCFYRIIGLYVSVVLVIGRALRSNIAALPSKITFNEIPNPDSLLELCNDIFYIREDGNLQQEEILVVRLFFIFRSPAQLLQQAKWKKDWKTCTLLLDIYYSRLYYNCQQILTISGAIYSTMYSLFNLLFDSACSDGWNIHQFPALCDQCKSLPKLS